MCLMVSRTIIIRFNHPMTLSMVLYERFLLPIMTGRRPMGQSGIVTWKRSIANAMPSFIRLSRFGSWRVNSTIMPIYKNKNKKPSKWIVQLWIPPMPSPLSLTDNLWSNIRWQWWQWLPRDTCRRTTTWFHHWSCPRCCGRPVTSHLGNPLNSWFTFLRLSLVSMHSTQKMILICTSKGNTFPNGLSWGSTNPLQFMMTTSSMKNGLSAPWRLINPPSSTNHPLLPGPLVQGRKKCTHGRYPLEFPFGHVIPTWCLSTNQLPGLTL